MKMAEERYYLCIDFKSFFASVECAERGLDPMTTNLVVADPSRGRGAICLAVSPSMKALGVRNRCRIYEIPDHIDYITALPRMKKYIEYSANIYGIYLKYISKDDIHVYSIDEAFLDITPYLKLYKLTPKALAKKIIKDIQQTTKIPATAGIGTNLYLAKVALDICAKHSPDFTGYLDEEEYKKNLWNHQPITDFWHVGPGIARRLAKYGIFDMEGVAKFDEATLYKEFGVNAEFLIDHAWGREPCTIAQIKAYKSKNNSISTGQILFEDYGFDDALLVLKEMVELKCLDLVSQHLVTDSLFLYIGYSKDVHKATGGSVKMSETTNSFKLILPYFIDLYNKTTSRNHPIRQISIGFANVVDERYESFNLFTDLEAQKKEKAVQDAIIAIKNKYGKNAILKGMNLEEKATTRKRNTLIGGHNSE